LHKASEEKTRKKTNKPQNMKFAECPPVCFFFKPKAVIYRVFQNKWLPKVKQTTIPGRNPQQAIKNMGNSIATPLLE
jgi:hypothetical protein